MIEPRTTRFEHLRDQPDDGTREGALGFLGAFVAGAALIPAGLTMSWVWMLILTGAIIGGLATQGLAQWNNTRNGRD